VKEVAVAVEYDLLDSLGDERFRDRFADLLRCVALVVFATAALMSFESVDMCTRSSCDVVTTWA
jgi:hypothetical protein